MRITIRYRGQELMKRDFHDGALTLGRTLPGAETADIDIPVDGDFISDRHGHFVVDGDTVEVVDGWPGGRTRSVYGVHVNGIRVDRFEVEPGDVVAFGDPSDGERHVEVLVEGDELVADSIPDFTGEWKRTPPPGPSPEQDVKHTQIRSEPVYDEPPMSHPHGEEAEPPTPTVPVPEAPPVHTSEATVDPEESTFEVNTAGMATQQPSAPAPAPAPTPMAGAAVTMISTREAELEVIRGANRQFLEESGVAADRAGFVGRKFKLHQHQQECIIGRDMGCDLVVFDPDPTVNRRISRHHVRIEYRPEEGMFRLYNRSGNGTFVKRLRSPVMDDAVLNDRDVFTIGRTAIQIRILGMAEATGPKRRSKPAMALAILGLLMVLGGGLAAAWSVFIAPMLAGRAQPQAVVAWTLELERREASRVEVAVGGAGDDGRLRILFAGGDGSVRAADGFSGAESWNEVADLREPAVVGQPVADVDFDGVGDFVLAAGDPRGHSGEVALLSGQTGAVIWQEEPGCESGGCSYSGPPAVAVDANGDGLEDIVVAGASRRGGVVALVDVSSGAVIWQYEGDRGEIGAIRQPPVVYAGPDGNVVVSVVTRDGSVLTFDAQSGAQVGGIGVVGTAPLASPAVGDLDGDGDSELVVLNDAGLLVVIDPFFSGGPAEVFEMAIDYSGIPIAALDRGRSTGPVIADLDGDGCDDVIIAHPGFEDAPELNQVYALRGPDLGGIWAYEIPEGFFALAPPAAADVNGDRVVDVILPLSSFDGREVEIVVLSGAAEGPGEELLRIPLSDGSAASSSPVVADVNGDGVLDVVLGLEGYGVQVLSLGVPARGPAPWPSLRGGAGNTADGNVRLSTLDRMLRLVGTATAVLGLVLLILGFVLQRRAQWVLG